MSPQRIAQAYIDTWNAADAGERTRLLADCWSPDVAYVDPLMAGTGTGEISNLVLAVKERFPRFRFQLRGTPDGHGPYVRLAWSLGEPGTPAPIEGSDVLELDGGRIRRVIGFIDRAPGA